MLVNAFPAIIVRLLSYHWPQSMYRYTLYTYILYHTHPFGPACRVCGRPIHKTTNNNLGINWTYSIHIRYDSELYLHLISVDSYHIKQYYTKHILSLIYIYIGGMICMNLGKNDWRKICPEKYHQVLKRSKKIEKCTSFFLNHVIK